jgi:DNA-binding transcriptional LysR family regulator
MISSPISPADMLLFADVITQGSFTAAAQVNGISKQAVSERVAKLEAVLGVRLLQRTTRSLKPTEAGQRYYLECMSIAERIEQANATILAEQSEPTGTLTISTPNVFGRANLISILKIYQARWPKVKISLHLTDRLVNLVEEGIDIALRVSQLTDSALSVRRLGTVHSYFVASPELIDAQQAKTDLELLRNAPALSLRTGEVWEMPDGSKLRPQSSITINDLVALTSACQEGLGVARLPGMLCRSLVEQNKLRFLLDGAPATSFSVYAAYLSKKQLAPKIRSFIDLLVEQRMLFTDAD